LVVTRDEHDKERMMPRDRDRRRRRVLTEDGQQQMKPYVPAANSGDSKDSKDDKTAKSAAEARREYIEEESGRSHDPAYGYEDVEMDEEQPEDGYQDVYTSGQPKPGNREEQDAAREARAEEPIEERRDNNDRGPDREPAQGDGPANRGQQAYTAASEQSDRPAHREEPARPAVNTHREETEDDTPKGGISGGAAAAAAAGAAYNYPGDKDNYAEAGSVSNDRSSNAENAEEPAR